MPNLKAVSFQAAVQDKYYNFITPVNEAVVGNLTTLSAYGLVPWLFRAVRLRAQGVSRMPFTLEANGVDVTDSPEFENIVSGMKRRLFLTEASKTLTGAAYWIKETNQYGLNLTPRWVVPKSIQPIGNELTGLQYFNRTSGKLGRLEIDQVVYFWNENFDCEYLPGAGEASVALAAASMLYALDAFTANFFQQGAVKVTVFPVPVGTQKEEVEKFQNFLQRRLTSVRNAFKMFVIRAADKLSPIVIGSDIKDTQAPELTDIQRVNVAAALGVPQSVIEGRSSDDSNSRSEKTAFVTDTLIPECEFIAEVANDQFFKPFGVKLKFHPDRLDIMQAIQLDQITAVSTAVGGPVLTQDEGRDLLGYKPLNQPKPVSVGASSSKPKRVDLNNISIENENGQTTNPNSEGGLSVSEDATILNGAQIASAIDVLNGAANGSVAELVAVELLVALGIDKERAKQMVVASLNITPNTSSPSSPAPSVTKALTDWRKSALESIKAGHALAALSQPASLPADLATIIHADLLTAKTATDVRAAFERHWPLKAEPSFSDTTHTLSTLLAELRAIKADLAKEPPPPAPAPLDLTPLANALREQHPPQVLVQNIVNLPRAAREWQKVLRDADDNIAGTETVIEYYTDQEAKP